MEIGIHFSYWAEDWVEDYHRYIEKAADLGFDILELSCSGILALYSNPQSLTRLREHAERRNLRLTAGYGPSPSQNLCSENRNVTENGLSFYRQILPLLHELGIHTLAGPLSSRGPLDASQNICRASDWKRAQKNLLCAADLARQYQITLALEVVNRYEGYLFNTCEEALRFVNEAGHPNLQILLDTFHMNIEEADICGAIVQAGSHLKHLHVSEQNRQLPGQGRLPWHSIGNALKSIDYQGAAIIESFVKSTGSIARQAKIWNTPAAKQTEEYLDCSAKNALLVLRNAFL